MEDATPPRVWGEWGEAGEATQRSGAASPSRLLRVADQRVGYPLNESEPESLSEGSLNVALPFKVYVYDLPLWANVKILKRNPFCSESAFGTEQYIHQQFLHNHVRTRDPEAADFFYVPVYATCLLYRDFGYFDHYRYLVKEVLNHIIKTSPYWNRTRGRDHIWPFVHDFGGCLSWLDNTDHVYFKELRNSIFLSHLGDLAMGCFQSYKDIVIPPMVTDGTLYRDGKGGINVDPAKRYIFAHFRGTVNWYHGNKMKQLYVSCGVVRCGVVWCGVVWYGVVCFFDVCLRYVSSCVCMRERERECEAWVTAS